MTSAEFIRELHSFTGGAVALQTLPGAAETIARRPSDVEAFVVQAERSRLDAYHCPVALRPDANIAPGEVIRRSKRNAMAAGAAWTDIDAKDITLPLEEAAQTLRELRFPPSRISWSGNGLHPYWLLSEAFDVGAEQERFEALLRRLVDKFGGDPAPAHVAALMRLPGTHNRKGGGAKLVTVEGDGKRYHFEDLEEWLDEQPVAITRKPTSRLGGGVEPESNPYLRAAREYNWKPTLDVQGELARMEVGNIHHTCVRVSASLLRRGEDAEDVIARLLGEVARAKAAGDEPFQERREERRLRAMCRSWIAKHPVERRRKEERVMDEPGEVHEYEGSAARAKKKARAEQAADDKTPKHTIIAKAIIEGSAAQGEPFLATLEPEGDRRLWQCRDGLWRLVVSVDTLVERVARDLRIPTTIKLRSEVAAAIRADPDITRPSREVRFDNHGMIPALNGLVDPKTREVHPYAPERYATRRLAYAFNPAAECPTWERAVADFFRDKEGEEHVLFCRLLQEAIGARLLGNLPRGLRRALILWGPANTGKSQILNVAGGLFSAEVTAQPLSSLAGEHGTVPLTKPYPWVLHEAFNQSQWVTSDKVKQIITGEPFQINIKRGDQFQHVFREPIFWATNHAPNLKDGSRAGIDRMLVIPCNAGFDDCEPMGGAAEAIAKGYQSLSEYILATEGEGVLLWAMDGLSRARRNGQFELPQEMLATKQELFDEANFVAGFVRECCTFDPDRMVRCADFLPALTVWWVEQKGEGGRFKPNPTNVGRDLRALGDARIAADRADFRSKHDRFYGGIILNDLGMEYWTASDEAWSARDQKSRRSTDKGEVNQQIPPGWGGRDGVVRMRMAHRKVGQTAATSATVPPQNEVTSRKCQSGHHGPEEPEF